MDNDTYGGQGNEYDYGFRIYNPRIGRFLSVDPLYKQYTQLTPYQFSSNSPICSIDQDGAESQIAVFAKNGPGPLKLNDVDLLFLQQKHNLLLTQFVTSNIKDKVKASINNLTVTKALSSFSFSTNNTDAIIQNTVSAFLNYSETTQTSVYETVSGDILYEYSTYADFNYDALGGPSFVSQLSNFWEENGKDIKDGYEKFKDLTGYEDFTDKIEEKVKESVLKYVRELAKEKGKTELLKKGLDMGGKALKWGDIVIDIVQQLGADAPVQDSWEQLRPVYQAEVESATITEMLIFFIGDASKLPKGINIHQNLDKPAVDDTYVDPPEITKME